MMGDNDFPTVMGNTPLGFLQTYVQGLQEYEQAGTDIPDLRLQNEYAQEMGGPLQQQMTANLPDCERMKVPFGKSFYKRPVLPGEKSKEEDIPFVPMPRA